MFGTGTGEGDLAWGFWLIEAGAFLPETFRQQYLGQDKWGSCVSTEAFGYMDRGYLVKALECRAICLRAFCDIRDLLAKGILGHMGHFG